MKKHFLSFLALVLLSPMAWAEITAPDDIPDYYASVDGKSAKGLYDAIQTTAKFGYSSLDYSGLWTAYGTSDLYPADSVGKAGHIWDMYSNCDFIYKTNQCGSYGRECDCYNREHSVPKSWFGGSTGKNTPGTDMFHVVPTDGKVNGQRGNMPFGEVDESNYSYDGCKRGTPKSLSIEKTILGDESVTVSCSVNVFEPMPQYKGDFARGYMGTLLKWSGDYQAFTKDDGSEIFSGQYNADGLFGLTRYGVALLMKWHREDPVSQKEIDRNNGIQATQGNRNPFIDYPYLAEYIWGEHAGEEVELDYLMPSTDPDFIPGVSDGLRRMVPPEPATMYAVSWSANGEVFETDSLAEETPISYVPDAPASCSSISTEFVGWTDAAIEGIDSEAPAVLYTLAAEFPIVTDDVTYYAVYAQLNGDQSYGRFITVCQGTEEVELVGINASARKILVGSQLYIQINEQLFNLQGQRIQ